MRIIFDKYLFEAPVAVIKCHRLSAVKATFDRLEAAVSDGYHLAGFLSYEAGYAFEESFFDKKAYDFPLVCFGVYEKPSSPRLPLARDPSPSKMERGGLLSVSGVRIRDYHSALRKIKKYLAAGETYQVNYTFKQKFDFAGDPLVLYQKLRKHQATPYSAFIETPDFAILSLSPELFFKKNGGKITVKPMKGTMKKGRGMRQRLAADGKNRAENLMIVDLLRNDLGRIAWPGSVKTRKLFEVERYKTLYQMTSTIEAKIPRDIKLYSLFRNIFPSGSVTGAPKIRTMQIIRELEKEKRNIYCGSIGMITPDRDMVFNVAIRTLLLTTYKGELGLGSGITFDSDPKQEYEECRLKAKFLSA